MITTKKPRESEMANRRQDKQSFESTVDEATRRMNEESTRVTRNIADISERAARANIEIFHDNMDIVRRFWQSATDESSSLASRSVERWFHQWERLLRSRVSQELTDAMHEQLVGVIVHA
jgi:uncharacterized NAD(P)/FAD-binding protein YdhS